jgi:hypothetical protein
MARCGLDRLKDARRALGRAIDDATSHEEPDRKVPPDNSDNPGKHCKQCKCTKDSGKSALQNQVEFRRAPHATQRDQVPRHATR